MPVRLELCEACQIQPVQVVENIEEFFESYRVCQDCHHRLVTFSLRPKEWYQLAVTYSPYTYYLHDDFYVDWIITHKDKIFLQEAGREA